MKTLMDPSKRICLKNIPPECTKREIAEFVRSRTGVRPHSIDLGLDKAGHIRRYAHFSVEGAKNVISVISGAMWGDSEITALPARPHYTYRLAEARRQRERQEAEERAQWEASWKERTERWMQKTGGELRKGKAPRSFYATRQRYGAIAAEIAKRLREEHCRKHAAPSRGQNGAAMNRHGEEEKKEEVKRSEDEKKLRGAGVAADETKRKRHRTEPAAAPPPPQQPPPQPDAALKRERKLSGLQARLAALRAKMK